MEVPACGNGLQPGHERIGRHVGGAIEPDDQPGLDRRRTTDVTGARSGRRLAIPSGRAQVVSAPLGRRSASAARGRPRCRTGSRSVSGTPTGAVRRPPATPPSPHSRSETVAERDDTRPLPVRTLRVPAAPLTRERQRGCRQRTGRSHTQCIHWVAGCGDSADKAQTTTAQAAARKQSVPANRKAITYCLVASNNTPPTTGPRMPATP